MPPLRRSLPVTPSGSCNRGRSCAARYSGLSPQGLLVAQPVSAASAMPGRISKRSKVLETGIGGSPGATGEGVAL
ncbi:MAG: hypothetical protein V9E93_07115 [Steroidobacteraceae bacterium]